MYLHPNITSILQLVDQGIICSLKCKYQQIFLLKMIDSCSKNVLVPQFLESFTLKDAIWACPAAWDKVAKDMLINAWRKLWPHDLFKDDDNKDGFPGFQLSAETQIITKLVDYSKQVAESGNFALEESDVTEILEANKDVPVIYSYTDDEIAQMVLNNVDRSDEETYEEVKLVSNQIKELTNDLVQ